MLAVTSTLKRWLEDSPAEEIVTWSHKILAHAADSASRGKVDLAKIGPNLEKISNVHRAVVRVAEMLGGPVLAETRSC